MRRMTPHVRVAVLGSVLWLAACGGGASNESSQPTQQQDQQSSATNETASAPEPEAQQSSPGVFAIESLPLDLAADVWQWPTDVSSWPASQFPPVHLFGKDYKGKIEATLTFDMLKVGTVVLSPVSGQVVDVRAQPESCDVELYIGDGSAPPISLDHIVTNLKRGDVVTAGQAVGTVPARDCKESFGHLELMVIGESGGQMLALCPVNFFSDELAATALPAIAQVMNDWNAYVGSKGGVTYTAAEIAQGVCATPTAPA